MMDSSFILYAMEKEGYLTTRESRINAAIKEFKKIYKSGKNPNLYIDEVLDKYNLDNITSEEAARISNSI